MKTIEDLKKAVELAKGYKAVGYSGECIKTKIGIKKNTLKELYGLDDDKTLKSIGFEEFTEKSAFFNSANCPNPTKDEDIQALATSLAGSTVNEILSENSTRLFQNNVRAFVNGIESKLQQKRAKFAKAEADLKAGKIKLAQFLEIAKACV